MASKNPNGIAEEYMEFIDAGDFPCVAAKAALQNETIQCLVAGHIACPREDMRILEFLYDFIDGYRLSDKSYQSAVVIFDECENLSEEMFDSFLWQRLQSLSSLDAIKYKYDSRVSSDPGSAYFSFSIKEEAFYIIGLHPSSSRKARQFKYPAMVFNPHAQFEELRRTNKFENIKKAIRKRDIALSGSVNPMLVDFGELSKAFQYSGRKYDVTWQCPFKIDNHQWI